MMAAEINNYMYWGLIGQGVSQATSAVQSGFAGAAQADISAGAYGASAQMLDIQAEQELINADAAANVRMEQYNESAAANAAVTTVMGKTSENTIIDDANLHAAERDISVMKRQAKLSNIGFRSQASAARSAAKQSKIARDSSMITGILGGIQGVAGSAAMYGMISGTGKTTTNNNVSGSEFRAAKASRPSVR